MARVLIALALALLAAAPAQAKSEAEWTAEWCGGRGLVYDTPGDGTRPAELALTTPAGRTVYADCMGTGIAVEVDFARKYRQGIMQATEYALLSGRLPFLLLIVERARGCRYVDDARWLVSRARIAIVISTTGVDCPRAVERGA